MRLVAELIVNSLVFKISESNQAHRFHFLSSYSYEVEHVLLKLHRE